MPPRAAGLKRQVDLQFAVSYCLRFVLRRWKQCAKCRIAFTAPALRFRLYTFRNRSVQTVGQGAYRWRLVGGKRGNSM